MALSRVRERTDIHVSDRLLAGSEGTPLERLARRVGRSEPEITLDRVAAAARTMAGR